MSKLDYITIKDGSYENLLDYGDSYHGIGFHIISQPIQIITYKLISSFESNKKAPRIGLRGTAKVYGSRVMLFYYLFRKPITFVRQLIGV